MGISSRDYIRDRPVGGSPLVFGQAIKGLIIANVVLYIIQVVFAPLTSWLQLSTSDVLHGQVWRVFTYGFCHDRYSLWHILFNMLFLWWFGRTLERMYGTRDILLFYFGAIVVSGLAFVGLDLVTSARSISVGASGGVMAILMLYTMHFPYEKIRIWMIIPVPVWLIVAGYVIFDLHPVLLALGGEGMNTGVAHAAHLGGLIFGFAYFKMGWRLETLFNHVPHKRSSKKRAARPALPPMVTPQGRVSKKQRSKQERVDDLLEKISQHGMDSLTDSERKFLDEASATLRERR